MNQIEKLMNKKLFVEDLADKTVEVVPPISVQVVPCISVEDVPPYIII